MINKKGFTLMELLAVIAILGLVVAIAVPSIVGIMNRNQEKIDSAQEKEFISIAKLWANDYKDSITDGCYFMSLNDMVEKNLLSEIPNDSDGNKYSVTSGVQITKNGIKLTYNYVQNKSSSCSSISGISSTDKSYDELLTIPSTGAGSSSRKYVDDSGANEPKLADGMIPVVYNGSSYKWEVADTSAMWYDYDEQWWANAVTVSDASLRSAEPGTEIPMSVINSMWVWIPRYKYKITGSIGSGSNVTNPPQIKVEFESGTATTGEELTSCSITATSCYYTHPAFRNGNSATLLTSTQKSAGGHTGWDEELTGFWVGKFETGTDDTTCNNSPSSSNCNKELNPIIKPDVPSLRYQTVSNQFKTSLKFAGGTMAADGTVTFTGNGTYGLSNTVDTHMIKNTEWGAVAYLSQSQYGKNGNSNYTTGADKEIYKNNSSGYYTGRSGGSPTQNSKSSGSYSYDGYSCDMTAPGGYCAASWNIQAGTGASTTGTIYGIYDMSGGANEYVMGNWAGTKASSGFTTFPEQKYWDKYTGTSSSDVTSAKAIKGDATYETMKWYSDNAYFTRSNSNWFLHGGVSADSSVAGVFYFGDNPGDANVCNGFRSVLIP